MSLSDLNSKNKPQPTPTQEYEIIEAELVVKPVATYEIKEIVKPEETDPMKRKYGRLANIAGSVMAMHSEQKDRKFRL